MSNRLLYPEYLFHGTTLDTLESFKKKLINTEYWGPSRKNVRVNLDFGKGFYTTIDLKQALRWGVKRAQKEFDTPCILQISCNQQADLSEVSHHVFVGESKEWASYILDHRTQMVEEPDPCNGVHTDVVIGPMADNNTGRVIEEYLAKGIPDLNWFYDKIRSKEDGSKLLGLELGNQVAFFNEAFTRSFLTLDSYWLTTETEGEWVRYDLQGDEIESIRIENR